uniref:HDC19000 n=1 Tax=Drosophila melanogaster TaxID=7227 RepID=Q6IIC4_DROME|nr:TPA_inf: HDC19000 [Drosophila melanogaster]
MPNLQSSIPHTKKAPKAITHGSFDNVLHSLISLVDSPPPPPRPCTNICMCVRAFPLGLRVFRARSRCVRRKWGGISILLSSQRPVYLIDSQRVLCGLWRPANATLTPFFGASSGVSSSSSSSSSLPSFVVLPKGFPSTFILCFINSPLPSRECYPPTAATGNALLLAPRRRLPVAFCAIAAGSSFYALAVRFIFIRIRIHIASALFWLMEIFLRQVFREDLQHLQKTETAASQRKWMWH